MGLWIVYERVDQVGVNSVETLNLIGKSKLVEELGEWYW
jgi:hypothetical protein